MFLLKLIVLPDQCDYFRTSKGAEFIITFMVRGARCFGSDFAALRGVRFCA